MPLIKSKSDKAFKTNVSTLMGEVGKSPHVSNETLAYIAGLFDGEGCVNFTQAGQQKTWVIRVMIRNTNLPVLEFVRAIFGGRIETKKVFKDHPTWKPSYCWRLDWDSAIRFLNIIDPWVRIKREQILVSQFWNEIRNRGSRPPTKDHIELTTILVDQLSWLNRKGNRLSNDIEPIQNILDTLPEEIRNAVN